MNGKDRVIAIGEQRVPGLYFFPDTETPNTSTLPVWLGDIAPPSSLDLPAVEYFFTDDQQGIPHIRNRLLSAIAAAKNKVFFCSWIFADDHIVRALCEAAERLRGGVYVLTALEKDLRPDRNDSDELDPDERKQQQRRERHIDNLHNLARAGAWLRSVPDCHPKFCVVDDDLLVVTSANATREAYEDNPENGVLLRSPELTRELGRLFAHAWLHLASFESPPGANINATQLRRGKVPTWRPLQSAGIFGAVCTLGRTETSLRERTVALIDQAEHEIAIATYSVVGLENHPVGNALRRALRRGVKLLLVMRQNNWAADQCATCGWLVDEVSAENFTVRGHAKTHAKAIVIDGRHALLWTGNLDGIHGYESGLEVGIAAEHGDFVAAVRRYVIDLAARSPRFGMMRPVLAELAAVTGTPWTQDLELRVDPKHAAQLSTHIIEPLQCEAVAYWKHTDDRFYLRIGRELHLRLIPQGNATMRLDGIITGPSVLGSIRPEGFLGRCQLRISIGREQQTAAKQTMKQRPRRATPQPARSPQGRARR